MRHKKYVFFGCIVLYALLCFIYALANNEGFCLRKGHFISDAEKKDMAVRLVLQNVYPDALIVYEKILYDAPDAGEYLEKYYQNGSGDKILNFDYLTDPEMVMKRPAGWPLQRLTGKTSSWISVSFRIKKDEKEIFHSFRMRFDNCYVLSRYDPINSAKKKNTNILLSAIELILDTGVYILYGLFWSVIRILRYTEGSVRMAFVILEAFSLYLFYLGIFKKIRFRKTSLFLASLLWFFIAFCGLAAHP